VEKLKRFLRRWPRFYHLLSVARWTVFVRRNASMVPTAILEEAWATLHERKKGWVELYWESQQEPYRGFVLERVRAHSFGSILEVGCNSGPNLAVLARERPGARMVGVDINAASVYEGSRLLAEEGIANVTLLVLKADELARFPDKSFDIVLTCGLLVMIGPDQIRTVIRDSVRIARKAVILAEEHAFRRLWKDPQGLGIFSDVYRRDYAALLRQFVDDENRIHIEPLPLELVKAGLNAVIEVDVTGMAPAAALSGGTARAGR